MIEKEGGTEQSSKRLVWAGLEIVEERDGLNNSLNKRYNKAEMTIGAGPDSMTYFYTRDHLGSVRELTDWSKAVRAHYDYDPFGRQTKLSGDLDADFGFTGHYTHVVSGLTLAPYRAYDAELGRWISRDPLGEKGGLNLYAYVENNPLSRIDPLGLVWYNPASWNWSKIGSAITAKWGVGLGLAAKAKLGPVKCKAGFDYTMSSTYNSEQGIGSEISGFAGVGLGVGGHEVGLEKTVQQTGLNSDLEISSESKTVVGYEYGSGKASSDGNVGLDVTAGVLRGSVEVNLPTVWNGITQ